MKLQDFCDKVLANPMLLSLTFEDITRFQRITYLVKDYIEIYGGTSRKSISRLPVPVIKMLAQILEKSVDIIVLCWDVFQDLIWDNQEEIKSDQDISLLNSFQIGIFFITMTLYDVTSPMK